MSNHHVVHTENHENVQQQQQQQAVLRTSFPSNQLQSAPDGKDEISSSVHMTMEPPPSHGIVRRRTTYRTPPVFPLPRHNTTLLTRRATATGQRSEPLQDPVQYSSLICGLLAGIAQAGLFNPYDRALFLSVRDERPFFHIQNWTRPYTGFFQSLGGRALSGGLYFPLEHFFLQCLEPLQSPSSPLATAKAAGVVTSAATQPSQFDFLAGTAAGAVNAVVVNPLSAIKYKTWGRPISRGFWTEASHMLRNGSIYPFFNGLKPTLYRDVTFGGCYTWLRLRIQDYLLLEWNIQQPWPANMIAAAIATVVSGPFNYARNMQYATKSRERADSTWQVLTDLIRQTYLQPSMWDRAVFLQNRLRIGWGTARVALGMSFAHSVYFWLHDTIRPRQ